MKDNTFFKPTALYKEFMILDLIEKNKDITQREIASQIGVAVSMVNQYLDEYESRGLIKRKYVNSKSVKYLISKKGISRKQVLNIQYLKASSLIYDGAKNNITTFLNQIISKGYKKILLYGGGEVADILLQTINSNNSLPLEVVAVIDDDREKINSYIVNKIIIPNSRIFEHSHDGILVASYKHNDTIHKKLIKLKYDKKKIIQFFD